MSVLLNDHELAQRILDHVAQRTTDLGTRCRRVPVDHYRSPERFAQELRLALWRSATPFCPSAALPEAGAYVARIAAGTPLVAVRGDDGVVRAFRNACRHRGMPIATGSGCARAFACPYHGWTYTLEGDLRHVPHAHGFPGLDRAGHGLVPVTAVEAQGLVFITQRDSTLHPDWQDALPELLAPDQQLFATRELEVEANWKVLLEGFLEGYHIRPTHRETFYPYGYDNLNVIETFGRNNRVVFPFRRIEALSSVPPEEWRIRGLLTDVYHLFPNTLVTRLSHHMNLVVLEPLAPGRTLLLTYSLTNPGCNTEELRAQAERDALFVNEVGVAEDRAVAAAIQKHLCSEANEAFVYGHFEQAIVHFHEVLDDAMAHF